MKKFRVFIDMAKEEQYLKDMAQQGWGLVHFSGWNIYTFEKIEPEARNYRIDYHIFKNKKDYLAYLTLFEDSGWLHISGSKHSGAQIFLPVNYQNQKSDIFSDSHSRNARYKRLYDQAIFFGLLTMIYLIIFRPSFKNISSWYLTPDTLNTTDLQLIGRIAMETFFVSLQVLPMIFLLLLTLYNAIIAIKVKKLINNEFIEE